MFLEPDIWLLESKGSFATIPIILYFVKFWLALTDDFRTIDWVGEFEFPNLVLKNLSSFK